MAKYQASVLSDPEFINLQPLEINPMMASCEIKVMYIGSNRNGSFINKEVATEMAKTLRGAPIVGYYNEEKKDFTDHGDRITIDSDGIKFENLTQPYGFVSPDAQVWFQKFEELDSFGNPVEREYLMTTGYLWAGQYIEAQQVLDQTKGQSMELDEETLNGIWAEDFKTGKEFFIINDAIFSKLCILGDEVEPCFEGASIGATSFALNSNFSKTLYKMMQDLNFALREAQLMEKEEKIIENEVKEEKKLNAEDFNFEDNQNKKQETIIESLDNSTDDTSFTADDLTLSVPAEDLVLSEFTEDKISMEEFKDLKDKYTALQTEYQSLVEFKNQIENEKKMELIHSFYMLSEEDKADVIEHVNEYSLDDIEAKLSVICVRKKVDFNLNKNKEDEKSPVTTFDLKEGAVDNSVPAWISALRHTKNNKNN